MAKITYSNKSALSEQTEIADVNKVKADDMNEIKSVINETLFTALGLDTDTYSTTTSYAVGDMVVYNNQIYECTTATSGNWDSTKWTLVPIIVQS